MKRYSPVSKFIAYMLACICFLVAIFCGYGTITLASADMYQDYPDSLTQPILSSEGKKLSSSVAQYYAAVSLGNCPDELLQQLYDELPYTIYNLRHSNDTYVIITQNGQQLYALGTPITDGIVFDEYKLTVSYPVLISNDNQQPGEDNTVGESSDGAPSNTYKQDIVIDGQVVTCEYYYETITVQATVSFHQSKLNNTNYHLLSLFYPYRYAMIIGLVVSLLLGISLTVYLIWVAGRNRQAQVELIGPNQLPLDVYLVGCVLLFYLFDLTFYQLVDTIYDFHLLLYRIACISIAVPLLLGLLCIFAAQTKCNNGYWWRKTVIARLFDLIRRSIRALLRLIPTIWQWLVVGSIVGITTLFTFLLALNSGEVLFLLIFAVVLFGDLVLLCYCGYCFGLLLTGSKKMAQGDTSYQIPEKYLSGSFLRCAQQLNSLSSAANAAVQNQIRSERMKTELITNVSHDIKTPLTSIVNFVDLLEKPHSPEDEQQYLEVLSRQSQRLKKLIEDLMELSKANTGNMSVTLIPLDAVETANQALGEFSDKLEAANLIPVFRTPDEPLLITADGRLLWRVLSNLLSNVVKYAAPNTRVYIDLAQYEDVVQLSIRNISKTELNISAEDLLERFVRGDASRNTDGSGLGLNIAKSLTEVQGGQFDLLLDGDLFKATLTFPRA